MSLLDEWEHRRGPVRRRNRSPKPPRAPATKRPPPPEFANLEEPPR